MEVGQDVLIVESHYVVGWTGVFSCVCMGCVNLCCIHQLGWCVYSPRFSGGLVSNYVVDTHQRTISERRPAPGVSALLVLRLYGLNARHPPGAVEHLCFGPIEAPGDAKGAAGWNRQPVV